MPSAHDLSAMGRHQLERYTRELFDERLERARVEALLDEALRVFGLETRMGLLQEECAELIVAVSHFRRGRADLLKVAEELADVELMCAQFRRIVDSSAVDTAKQHKLKRLEDRVKRGEDV